MHIKSNAILRKTEYFNLRKIILVMIIALLAPYATSNSWATDLTVTNTWSSSDTLNAADLNKNFADTEDAVNDNDSRINGIQTQTQNLATGCLPGAYIRAIAADGTISCEEDDDTNFITSDSADSFLRIIRGSINATVAPTVGDGFTVVRTGTGNYTINYSTPFTTQATVTANTWNINGFIQVTTSTVSFCQLRVFDKSGALTDAAFHFIAIGEF